LEIVRVLEAGHALKESPDYELHRLTTQTPAFFDETVGRHVASLEKELAVLEGKRTNWRGRLKSSLARRQRESGRSPLAMKPSRSAPIGTSALSVTPAPFLGFWQCPLISN
jgi:hypothetical protein